MGGKFTANNTLEARPCSSSRQAPGSTRRGGWLARRKQTSAICTRCVAEGESAPPWTLMGRAVHVDRVVGPDALWGKPHIFVLSLLGVTL